MAIYKTTNSKMVTCQSWLTKDTNKLFVLRDKYNMSFVEISKKLTVKRTTNAVWLHYWYQKNKINNKSIKKQKWTLDDTTKIFELKSQKFSFPQIKKELKSKRTTNAVRSHFYRQRDRLNTNFKCDVKCEPIINKINVKDEI